MPKKNIFIRSKLKKAELLLRENKPLEAIIVYKDICKREGSNTEIWLKLSTLQRQAGDYLQAEMCARNALELSPDSPISNHLLGAALHIQGRAGEAIKYYERAIQLQPDLTDSHYYLANALRETGNIDDAVIAYNNLLEINPDHFEGLNNYGALLTNTGGAEEATKILTRALNINGNSVETLTNLARCLSSVIILSSGWSFVFVCICE
jgi:tetratricopeptide (TPR) repeat protein